jgi:hypothetical protein
MAIATARLTTTDPSATRRRRLPDFRMLLVRLSLAAVVTVVASFALDPQSAAAASFDRRIASPQQVKCLGNEFGLTPTVRVTQPFVIGRTASFETIKWMPYLQRWVPGQGWTHLLRSADWMKFQANRNGTDWYQYAYQPRIFTFSNLKRGSYYRVIHVVQWTSNGELGTMPSNYYLASGACLL